ncbi:hypothetical protein EEL49_12290 [Muribaculaceae bacterium Isolate-104 (HZI)]|nr:hypothetical protein EEL49_12290 [Muribaculaceae bacterium Isolate-104 (HZI)]
MERIELFDKYIAGTLSKAEVAEFRTRLDSDEKFATDFKVYLISVRGICQEAEQENIEFGHAMKSLTKAQLQSIIGKNEKPRIVRPNIFLERMMWISSMAAMLVVAIGIGWNLYTSSQNHICDVVYSLTYQPIDGDRSDGSEYLDLNELTAEQIEMQLPDMTAIFEADEIDSQDWHIDGMNLAMAYLKLHRKSDAVKVLETMVANSSEPDEYNRIIKQLK